MDNFGSYGHCLVNRSKVMLQLQMHGLLGVMCSENHVVSPSGRSKGDTDSRILHKFLASKI